MFDLEKNNLQRRLVTMVGALLFSAACVGTAVSPAASSVRAPLVATANV